MATVILKITLNFDRFISSKLQENRDLVLVTQKMLSTIQQLPKVLLNILNKNDLGDKQETADNSRSCSKNQLSSDGYFVFFIAFS